MKRATCNGRGRIRERGFSNPRLTADRNVRAPMSARPEDRPVGRPLQLGFVNEPTLYDKEK